MEFRRDFLEEGRKFRDDPFGGQDTRHRQETRKERIETLSEIDWSIKAEQAGIAVFLRIESQGREGEAGEGKVLRFIAALAQNHRNQRTDRGLRRNAEIEAWNGEGARPIAKGIG